jgi:hypothetical protein
MPTHVAIGQCWSTWVPGRRQWLLTKVIRQEGGEATLLIDPRYGLTRGQDEQRADEYTMLNASNLYRFVDDAAAPNAH